MLWHTKFISCALAYFDLEKYTKFAETQLL